MVMLRYLDLMVILASLDTMFIKDPNVYEIIEPLLLSKKTSEEPCAHVSSEKSLLISVTITNHLLCTVWKDCLEAVYNHTLHIMITFYDILFIEEECIKSFETCVKMCATE